MMTLLLLVLGMILLLIACDWVVRTGPNLRLGVALFRVRVAERRMAASEKKIEALEAQALLIAEQTARCCDLIESWRR